MRYELRTTVRVSDEWLSVCAICLHTGLNPKGHQAAYALPNLFAAHDNEEPRYKGLNQFGHLLFDLQNDPQQLHPIDDDAIEARMIALLIQLMKDNDAPPEQFQRLGLA